MIAFGLYYTIGSLIWSFAESVTVLWEMVLVYFTTVTVLFPGRPALVAKAWEWDYNSCTTCTGSSSLAWCISIKHHKLYMYIPFWNNNMMCCTLWCIGCTVTCSLVWPIGSALCTCSCLPLPFLCDALLSLLLPPRPSSWSPQSPHLL